MLAPLIAARPGCACRGLGRVRARVRAILASRSPSRATRSPARWSAPTAALRAERGPDPYVPTPQPWPARISPRSACRAAGPGAQFAGRGRADPAIFGPSRSLEEAVAQLKGLTGIANGPPIHSDARAARAGRLPRRDIGLMRALADETAGATPVELLAAPNAAPLARLPALHLWAATPTPRRASKGRLDSPSPGREKGRVGLGRTQRTSNRQAPEPISGGGGRFVRGGLEWRPFSNSVCPARGQGQPSSRVRRSVRSRLNRPSASAPSGRDRALGYSNGRHPSPAACRRSADLHDVEPRRAARMAASRR